MRVWALHQQGHVESVRADAQQEELDSARCFYLITKFMDLLFWDSLTKTFLSSETLLQKMKPWKYIAIYFIIDYLEEASSYWKAIQKDGKCKNRLVFPLYFFLFK